MKLADDAATSLNPNIGSLNYDVDLNDTGELPALQGHRVHARGEGFRQILR